MSFSRTRSKAFYDAALNLALGSLVCGMAFFIIFTITQAVKS
jgi:hypothetical protein